MVTIVLLILVGLCAALPIGVAFALPSILGATSVSVPPTLIAATVPFQNATSFSLLAIPYFLLAGQVMTDGGMMLRLERLAEALLGWLRGALGYVTIAASAMLGSVTGSSVATVAAIGSSVGTRMAAQGYRREYVATLVGASGLLGVLIPPSIPLIVYAAVAGESVTALFVATVVPALLMLAAFMLVHRLALPRVFDPATATDLAPAARPRRRIALWQALPSLLMPVILFGGIYSGVFTPTEAAAAAAMYGLLLTVLTRALRLRSVPGVLYRAALPAAAILAIIAFSSVFNRLITLEQVPQQVAEAAIAFTDNPLVFLLAVNVVLFLVGMLMETNAAVLLMAPLLAPAADQFGLDPVHFGIVLVTNIELGLITPPLAANLYVAAKTGRVSIVGMLPHLSWFLLAAVTVLLAVTYVPALTTWHL